MLRSSQVLLVLLCCTLLAVPTLATAGEGHMSFGEAQELATERGVPVVIDFFTDWCIYCKHFDRDLASSETGISKALDEVVFTSIDAEKGEGIELAKKYAVQGFPTYLVVDAQGELIDRWSGYGGPEHFLGALGSALEDPITLAEKKARFEKQPNAGDAQTLARMASAAGEHARAIELFETAESLDSTLDLGEDILVAAFYGMRTGSLSADEFMGRANTIGLADDAPVDRVLMAMSMVDNVAAQDGADGSLRLPFLERAVKMIDSDPGAVDDATRYRVGVAKALHIDKNPEKAAQIRKKMMPDGWMESAQELNAYAWWCFENNVNLEEAESLARRAIEYAEPGKTKAMVLDTAAEICNARGDCRDAVTLIESAIVEEPDNQYYKQQLERFQKILASSE